MRHADCNTPGPIGPNFARDGQSLLPTQTLAKNLRASDFQDAAQFLIRCAQAIENAHLDMVPKILIGGDQAGPGGSNGNVTEALLTRLRSDKIGA